MKKKSIKGGPAPDESILTDSVFMKEPSRKSLTEIDADLRSPELRWEAASHLAEYTEDASSDVWKLVLEHGSSDDEDLRSAIATCVLEHLLETSFDRYFSLLEFEVRKGNRNLMKTLKLCWKFGESERSSSSDRWDELVRRCERQESGKKT